MTCFFSLQFVEFFHNCSRRRHRAVSLGPRLIRQTAAIFFCQATWWACNQWQLAGNIMRTYFFMKIRDNVTILWKKKPTLNFREKAAAAVSCPLCPSLALFWLTHTTHIIHYYLSSDITTASPMPSSVSSYDDKSRGTIPIVLLLLKSCRK